MNSRAADRVVDAGTALNVASGWSAAGERVAIAFGAFDIPGARHARFLEAARSHGVRLVVGVLGDAWAAQLQGPGRPVTPARDRAALVAALRGVDLVLVVDEAGAEALRHALPTAFDAGLAEAGSQGGDLIARVRERYPVRP